MLILPGITQCFSIADIFYSTSQSVLALGRGLKILILRSLCSSASDRRRIQLTCYGAIQPCNKCIILALFCVAWPALATKLLRRNSTDEALLKLCDVWCSVVAMMIRSKFPKNKYKIWRNTSGLITVGMSVFSNKSQQRQKPWLSYDL